MSDETRRATIKLPMYHHQWLKVWAHLKGRGVSTLATDIVQARVEANLDQINLMLESRAKDRGLSPEELIAKILSNEDD